MTLEYIAEQILKFVNYGITILLLLLLVEVIRFALGPKAAAAEVGLEAAGKKFKKTKKSFRRARRAFTKAYRIDKDLPDKLDDINKAIKAKDPKKLSDLLKKGRKELEKEAELLIFLHDTTKKVEDMAASAQKTKLETKIAAIDANITAKFDELKSSYEEMEIELGKTLPNWADAQAKMNDCRKALAELTKNILGLEAVEKQATA